MAVLLLRLAGPMQSWGTQSRFSVRDTGREPSKSGIVGLLCAAAGVPRNAHERIAELAQMRMGVRVDREGTTARDFHTAGGGDLNGKPYGVAKASGATAATVTSNRYYLADAEFIVGLESDDTGLLKHFDRALADPVWPLFLGRKSFPPGLPVRLGVQVGELEEVLVAWPWRPQHENDDIPERGLRLVIEVDDYQEVARYDHPVSFEKADRRFRLRHVNISWIPPNRITKGESGCICPG